MLLVTKMSRVVDAANTVPPEEPPALKSFDESAIGFDHCFIS